MRTTLIIDDDLFKKAAELTHIKGMSALVQEGLRALVSQTAAKRLSELGGSDTGASSGRRRK